MTTEVAAQASETYRKTPNTFSFQCQSTVLLTPTPATVSRTSLSINLTGNRQITLAGTTRELRAYLLTLPGPLPAPASELRAGRWVKVGGGGGGGHGRSPAVGGWSPGARDAGQQGAGIAPPDQPERRASNGGPQRRRPRRRQRARYGAARLSRKAGD